MPLLKQTQFHRQINPVHIKKKKKKERKRKKISFTTGVRPFSCGNSCFELFWFSSWPVRARDICRTWTRTARAGMQTFSCCSHVDYKWAGGRAGSRGGKGKANLSFPLIGSRVSDTWPNSKMIRVVQVMDMWPSRSSHQVTRRLCVQGINGFSVSGIGVLAPCQEPRPELGEIWKTVWMKKKKIDCVQ